MGVKQNIKKLCGKILMSRAFLPNRKIIFESNPDMSDHSEKLFRYMIDRGLNRKYKMIWMVYDKEKFRNEKIRNVSFRNYTPKNVFERLGNKYHQMTARILLYGTRYLPKTFEGQWQIYLMHGTVLKSRLRHCRTDDKNESDAIICISEYFRKTYSEEVNAPANRFITTGYPRNDYLFEHGDFISKVYPGQKFDKVICWMPTFRRTRDGDRVDSDFNFPLGIPIIYSEEECLSLNEYLEKRNILLVLKPHPSENLQYIDKVKLSNLRVLYDSELLECGVKLYQFLGATDAMITDYSSVYYDYLLTGKPIGITLDDLEAYDRVTGFVFDNVTDIVKGRYIYNAGDLKDFADEVNRGEDNCKEERERVTKLIHVHTDAHSTERVYELVMSKLEKNKGDRE